MLRESQKVSVAKSRVRGRKNRQQQESEMANLLTEERDLKQLTEEYQQSRVTVFVDGVTQDTAVLHRYVARLNSMSLLEKVQIQTIEKLEESRDFGSSKFRVQLIVRPGYGRPGGPRGIKASLANQERKTSLKSSL